MDSAPKKEQIFAVLRQVLKAKGLKYAELAKLLKMSESGIKKVFQEKNCSLEKLLKICQALEVDAAELFELAQRPLTNNHLLINQSLEEFLISKPRAFHLLRFIQTKDYSKNWLYEKGFNDDDFEELKEKLIAEKVLKEGEGLFSLRGTCIRYQANSKMRKLITKKYGRKISQKALSDEFKTAPSLEPILWSQPLSESDEDNIRRDFIEVLEKYVKRSSLYREHIPVDEHELTYLIIPTRFTPGSDEIENLDSF